MELMICRVWIISEFVETAETVAGGGGGIWVIDIVNIVKVWDDWTEEKAKILKGVQYKVNTTYSVYSIFIQNIYGR